MSDAVLGVDLNASDTSVDLASQGNDISYEAFVQQNVGDGKKFKTIEEALVALAKKAAHADTFIETLKLEKKGAETEKERLAAQLAEAKKVEDLLAVLNTDPVSQQTPAAAAVTGEEISRMVKDLLAAEKEASAVQQQKEVQAANQDKAWKSIVAAFENEAKAKEAIRTYVGKDAAKADILNRMGAYQPEAVVDFLKLQLKGTVAMDGVGDTSFNVSEDLTKQTGQLTWAMVQKVKKDNPKLYKSRQFQMEIHKAAAANPNFWK